MSSIVQTPHPVLNACAKEVGDIPAVRTTINTMIRILKEARNPEGVGLAAPQIGVSKRIFIMRPTKESEISVFINPKMEICNTIRVTCSANKTKQSQQNNTKTKQKRTRLEGCLSIGSVWGPVKRAPHVTLTWTDVDGKPHTRVFTGFEATIIQHEMDHLEGVLFTQRVLEQGGPLYKEKDGELETMNI